MDVFLEDNDYRLVVEVPGATKETLEVSPGPIAGTVTVRCATREERLGTPLRSERGAGRPVRYERVVPVAWDADVTRARPELRDGVLVLTIPRKTNGSEKPLEKK